MMKYAMAAMLVLIPVSTFAVTGSGNGTEVTGSGNGTEVTGSGNGTEVTGSGNGTEVTGSGNGVEGMRYRAHAWQLAAGHGSTINMTTPTSRLQQIWRCAFNVKCFNQK